jgi:uncharacterized ferritin-like protein (DUF455 family)
LTVPSLPSVAAAARAVLLTADPRAKVMAARHAAREWRAGRLEHRFDIAMPKRPARPLRPELLPPAQMPRRGKVGSERGRIAMLHALAHIEFVAIDLAFDLIGRFGGLFPAAFIDDWMRVGAEESLHFAILDRRLRTLGHTYGDLPAHDGLWQAAEATSDDALARLAVVPMVLEARGLDVTPEMIRRFESVGDVASARLLERILRDEIRHVGAGVRWFESACEARGFEPQSHWKCLVTKHFGGMIKPPFNDSARATAGLTKDFYLSLAR